MFSERQANNANYATAGICLTILLIRLLVGRWRRRPIDLPFYLIILSILSVTARVTLNYYQLHLGTSNNGVDDPNYFTTHSPSSITAGSKVVLAARIALTCDLWLQVCLLLLFYSQILHDIRWVRTTITITWIVAALTFIAVILVSSLECHPFPKYWQTHPSPPRCSKAYAQLWTQCLCNIILDLLLLAISFPILFHRGRNISQNIRVGSLFLLGTFCLVVTIMRLTAVFGNGGSQSARTVWGAVQVIVATFVANAPTTYGDFRVMYGRRGEAEARRTTRSESWTRSSFDEEAGGGGGGGGRNGNVDGNGRGVDGKAKETTGEEVDLESLDEDAIGCVPTINEGDTDRIHSVTG